MRRTAHRAEEWIEIPNPVTRPLLVTFPGDVRTAGPRDEWTFGGELRIKVLAVDTSTRIGKLTLAVGRGPDYEGRTVVEGPIRRRSVAPCRLSRGMRCYIRRMKAARP